MSRIEEALRRANQAGPHVVEWEPSEGVEPLNGAVHTASDAVVCDEPELDTEPPPVRERSAAMLAAAPGVDDMRPATTAPGPVGQHASEKLIAGSDTPTVAVEQYRRLAAALHQVRVERGTKIVMVASAMAGEGKTLTAANLAVTLSKSFHRTVLLIDADLRRPTIHEVFDISNMCGLNDGLQASCTGKLSLVEVSPQLTVLPAGRPNPDPMSGLTSDRMRCIIEEAAAKYDWVVVDTPPVALLPDAKLLAEMVDMVVLVIGAGMTPFRSIQRMIETLGRERIVGVVLNRAIEPHGAYQYYNAYYGAAARSER